MKLICFTRYFIGAILLITTQMVRSQQSFNEPFYLFNNSDIIEMPAVRLPLYASSAGEKDGSLHFAHPFLTDISVTNSGRWINLNDGSAVWTTAIRSEGAKSLNLVFDRFRIDKNSCLIIYSPFYDGYSVVLTNDDITPTGLLPTIPIPGDMLVVEYQQYSSKCEAPEIVIGSVNHDFLGVLGLLDSRKAGRFGDSGRCNIDVSCSSDELIVRNQKSTCKIIVDGTELCSGTLVNNSANDGTPYFLSAAHCFRRNESPFSTIFFFDYEVPSCQTNIEGTKLHYITGGMMRAFVDTFDIALLEMNKRPDAAFMPYWAGWSRSESLSPPFFAIHHPMGDVKKYAITNNQLIKTTFYSYTVGGKPFSKDIHWQVKSWETGVTEGGSSGCGLFDSQGRLVGSLSGGEATCSRPQNDYFVRFNKAWSESPDQDKQLACWLDPKKTSPVSIDGTGFYSSVTERITPVLAQSSTAAFRLKGVNGGFAAGHNREQHTAFAQLYGNLENAVIDGVYLVSGFRNQNSEQTFSVNLWDDNNGLPGQKIASLDNIPVSLLKYNSESYFKFTTPVEVSGPFHAGIKISYQQPVDTIALMMSKTLPGGGEGGMSFFDGSKWRIYTDENDASVKAALWVDILATATVKKPDDDSKNRSLHIYPQQVRSGFTISVDDDMMHTVSVFDINGKIHKSIDIKSNRTYIECSSLASGIYIVRVKLNNGFFERKIIKLP